MAIILSLVGIILAAFLAYWFGVSRLFVRARYEMLSELIGDLRNLRTLYFKIKVQPGDIDYHVQRILAGEKAMNDVKVEFEKAYIQIFHNEARIYHEAVPLNARNVLLAYSVGKFMFHRQGSFANRLLRAEVIASPTGEHNLDRGIWKIISILEKEMKLLPYRPLIDLLDALCHTKPINFLYHFFYVRRRFRR